MSEDPRRHIPRTDDLLARPAVSKARSTVAEHRIRGIIASAQNSARAGEIAPQEVAARVEEELNAPLSSLRPVLNATGVIVHTNLGRAPLPEAAIAAMADAATYTDVELDMESGQRSARRGQGVRQALLAACPAAEDALVVNNGAAALLLACAGLAEGREVIVSRGELIEIGAGFRLPELIESARVTLREVGATNRTHLRDYEAALGDNAGAILKVHPSNYVISGFTAAVGAEQLRGLGVPVIVDLGSGLLNHEEKLPQEPDINAQLEAGADIVIASGDKLLGGPQAGIVLGTKGVIGKLRRHPLARAVRMDKIRLAALEATLNGARNAVRDALYAQTYERTVALAGATGGTVVEHAGRVGGGGAPEYPLAGWAVAYPAAMAAKLRAHRVLPRVTEGQCLVDLRCIPPAEDSRLSQLIAGL